MSHREPRKGCCRRVSDYLSYAVSVAGRRLLTLFDVATDMRTFLILWNDPNTVVIACFLLASISAPLLVYWASSLNFTEAIIAHKTFGERRPKTHRERCHRNFYNVVAIPLLGVYVTSLQVVFWWLSDIFMSVFCQARHRREVSRLEQREFCQRDRSMPLIMPARSARFMAIVELSYESFPQTVLQLWVYFWHSSTYFTLFDVCLSVGASLANMVFNVLEILFAARTRAMFFSDFLLYFLSGQLDDMQVSGVPVRRALRNASCEECDISGFHTLYARPEALRNLRLNIEGDQNRPRAIDIADMQPMQAKRINGTKRIILPEVPDRMHWTSEQFEEIVRTVIALRRHVSIHVTLPHVDETFFRHFATSDFQHESANAISRRGRNCNVRAARRLNRVFGCYCGTRPGDALCATNTRVLGERHETGAACCASRVMRNDPSQDMRQRVLLLFKNIDAERVITSRVVRLAVQYLVVGDMGMLRSIAVHLSSPFMRLLERELAREPVRDSDSEEKRLTTIVV